MRAYNPNQYYNDYVPEMEKTRQPLVTVNWPIVSKALSEAVDVVMGIAIIVLLIITAGIC